MRYLNLFIKKLTERFSSLQSQCRSECRELLWLRGLGAIVFIMLLAWTFTDWVYDPGLFCFFPAIYAFSPYPFALPPDSNIIAQLGAFFLPVSQYFPKKVAFLLPIALINWALWKKSRLCYLLVKTLLTWEIIKYIIYGMIIVISLRYYGLRTIINAPLYSVLWLLGTISTGFVYRLWNSREIRHSYALNNSWIKNIFCGMSISMALFVALRCALLFEVMLPFPWEEDNKDRPIMSAGIWREADYSTMINYNYKETGMCTGINLGSDGRFLTAGAKNNTIKIYDRSGDLLQEIPGYSKVSASPDGKWLIPLENYAAEPDSLLLKAVSTVDGSAEDFLTAQGLPKSFAREIEAVIFSPGGTHVLVGSSSGLLLFDCRTKQLLGYLRDSYYPVWLDEQMFFMFSGGRKPLVPITTNYQINSTREPDYGWERLTQDACGEAVIIGEQRTLKILSKGKILADLAKNRSRHLYILKLWPVANSQQVIVLRIYDERKLASRKYRYDLFLYDLQNERILKQFPAPENIAEMEYPYTSADINISPVDDGFWLISGAGQPIPGTKTRTSPQKFNRYICAFHYDLLTGDITEQFRLKQNLFHMTPLDDKHFWASGFECNFGIIDFSR